MTLNLPAGAITAAATISPLALFLQADIVVKGVMIGLLLASIWTWAMIIGFSVTLRKARRDSRKFAADFWKAEDIARSFGLETNLVREALAAFSRKGEAP